MTNLFIGVAAIAVVALFEGLYYAFAFISQKRHEDLQRRLRPGGGDDPQASLLRSRRLAANPLVESFLDGLPFVDSLVNWDFRPSSRWRAVSGACSWGACPRRSSSFFSAAPCRPCASSWPAAAAID